MTRPSSSTGTPAIEALVRAGVAHRVHAYRSPERHGPARDARPAYGREAAEALGVDPGRVFKTLVVRAEAGLALAVVPTDGELDLKAVASALGSRRAALVEPAEAERATGAVVGGISPLGSRRPLPVVLDAEALAHPTVFVSAGRRGLQLELAGEDLVRLAGAVVAPIRRA